MTETEQQLCDQIGHLTLELNVMRLVAIHLVARTLGKEKNPSEAFRKFADEVHASVDRARPPPAAIAARIEQSRDEIDRVLRAIEQRLRESAPDARPSSPHRP
jgi:hypothetical protein